MLPDGTLGVQYHDLRNDDAGAPLVTSTWLLHSHDGGRTFTESKVGDDFDLTTAAQPGNGFYLGAYEGMAVRRGTFQPFFAVANGTPDGRAGDIFTAATR